mgnify:CR=1 FL=1
MCHGFHQPLVEFGGGVVAHALLTVVHGGNLDDDRKVSSRGDGDQDRRHLDAEDIGSLPDATAPD